MLGLPPSVRIYFATELTDMRNGIDGLRAIVEGMMDDNYFCRSTTTTSAGRLPC